MRQFFADFHIHIGRTEQGHPVKISGSRDLTFYNIAWESARRKGIDIVGIIDCHSPVVREEIRKYLDEGEMEELKGGGIRYRQTTIFLGSEIEVKEPGRGPAHVLAFFPTLETMSDFAAWLGRHMKNVNLSSQRVYAPARVLQEEVRSRGGLFIPAHIFTPHKSVYGSAADRIAQLFDPAWIDAVELGLSADTMMASCLSELDRYPFLSNSDAHSLGKIGREYNVLRMAEPTFAEWKLALAGKQGRKVAANYGLSPRLGKYHRTFCLECRTVADGAEPVTERCGRCGSRKIVRGVLDRIWQIADRACPSVPAWRPPYRYQVPLEFIPGLGKSKLEALLSRFQTEMRILHQASQEELAEAAGESIARTIVAARNGDLALSAGGGGRYGKIAGS
jgi:uncharacterized protein (TIGR00375 family)